MYGIYIVCCIALLCAADAFVLQSSPTRTLALEAGGFGTPSAKKKVKQQSKLVNSLNDEPSNNKKKQEQSKNRPYVKSEQDALLAQLEARSAQSCIGQALANSPLDINDIDPFWQLVPSLIASKFPNVPDKDLKRVAGFVSHTLDPNKPLEDDIINDPWRPHDDMHAYMPGLGPTSPFHDPSQLDLCKQLSENYDVILQEYHALLDDMKSGGKDRFQSVTSMNYESGWKTLVLFYNSHRIPGFPYHLCPTTTRIMESVPLAGRIAGFNRQKPKTGIPLHSDGNNMWLTCQMGIKVPENAWIRVGQETRHWKQGECLLYDTTYEHKTMNEDETEERVVLHVDFFNTLTMTKTEIEVMQYIYSLREQFMKAEGAAKVGAHIL